MTKYILLVTHSIADTKQFNRERKVCPPRRLEQLGSNMRRKKKRTLTLPTSHIPKINLRWITDHRSTVKAKTMKALLENVERISLGPRGKYLNWRNKVVAVIEKN